MALHETFLYINRNIEDVVRGFTAVDLRKVEDEDQIVYIAENTSPMFALSADLISSAEKSWTHLLYENPNDAKGVAETLNSLHIQPSEIKAATKYNGVPLVELADITALLEASVSQVTTEKVLPASAIASQFEEQTGEVPEGVRYAQSSGAHKQSSVPMRAGKKWVIIDAEGLLVGRLASIIAATLNAEPKATDGRTVENVVVVNASKLQSQGIHAASKGVRARSRFSKYHNIATAGPAERLIYRAVVRLMAGKRQRQYKVKKLIVYAGSELSSTEGSRVRYPVELITDNLRLAETISVTTGVTVETARPGTSLDRITRKL